jgi:hypothetical protein
MLVEVRIAEQEHGVLLRQGKVRKRLPTFIPSV